MVISEIREQIYIEDDEDIHCFECSELLDSNDAFTCECQQEFCEEHIKNHEC